MSSEELGYRSLFSASVLDINSLLFFNYIKKIGTYSSVAIASAFAGSWVTTVGSKLQNPNGVFAWYGSCYCLSLSLCHLVCITQPFLWSCLEVGVSLNVKNVMIHSPVDSFSAVIFPSVKSGVKPTFSEPDRFYENDCHSGCCWTGCSQRVDP